MSPGPLPGAHLFPHPVRVRGPRALGVTRFRVASRAAVVWGRGTRAELEEPALTDAVVERLLPGADLDPVPGRQGLRVDDAGLGAAERTIRPLDSERRISGAAGRTPVRSAASARTASR